jgi:membrane protein
MATLAQSRSLALVRAIGARSRADDVSTHAAALAYQLFLSTLALSLVGLALIGLAEDLLPFELPEGTGEQFANLAGASSATLGVVSLLALLWTASGLSRRASRALAVIFRTGPEGAMQGGLRALGTTLALLVLVGALPVVTGIISAVRVSSGLEIPFRVLGFAATAAMEFGLFLLAYTVLTPGSIGWRSHLPGALVMTTGWELFKLAGGMLLAYYVSRATLLYGTIGTVVGLLLFLRLASELFVFGAELSAVLLDRRTGPSPND